MKFKLFSLLLLTTSCFYVSGSFAESEGFLNKLLAPGPLMEGHKKLEGTDCLKCHEAGKGISQSQCLNCHKEIKPFIDSQKGFHGLASKSQACIDCHSDHKGRDLDSTLFDEKKFDHNKMTGYSLDGKHGEIKCSECHTEKRTMKPVRPKDNRFLGTKASSCRSCHKKDDIHFYQGEFAKKDCNACHGNVSWKENINFYHEKDTRFKLVEKHSQLKCNDCHLTDKKKKTFKYKWDQLEAKACLNCHQDFHKNKLSPKYSGGQCTQCHNQTKWNIEKFDHGMTGFKLNGKHSEARCFDCHITGLPKKTTKTETKAKIFANKDLNFTGLKRQCLSCHEDFHKFDKATLNKNPDMNQCSKCHEESDWKKTHFFNHNTQTSFVIDGQHQDLKCSECHLPQFNNKKAKNDSTLKMDFKVPTYHWPQLNQKTCESCHKTPHIGEFSVDLLKKKCTTCHTTTDWFTQKSDSGFDHNKTRFQLTGSHTKTKCSSCHGAAGQKKFKFPSKDQNFCIDCHSNIHNRQFTSPLNVNNCSQCHSTEKFMPLNSFDHSQTGYTLNGKHNSLKCSDCHTPSNQKYTLKWPNFHSKNPQEQFLKSISTFRFPTLKAKACLQCHDDYHIGQLGKNCTQCHSEKEWKPFSFDHNKQSRFSLLGKHTDVKCEKCHKVSNDKVKFKNELRKVVTFKPVSTQCADCHKDAHKGNFGKTCQECHNEKGWKSTKDFHKNFSLSGVHYTLDCTECHKDGKKLAGLSQECIACHQKDDVHYGSEPNCKNCHTQQFWEITSFRHSLTKFPLRGAHRVIECSDCHLNGIYKGLSSSCYQCHKGDFEANPSPHSSGNTNCIECHKNTFTFSNPN